MSPPDVLFFPSVQIVITYATQVYDDDGRVLKSAVPYTTNTALLKKNHPLYVMVSSIDVPATKSQLQMRFILRVRFTCCQEHLSLAPYKVYTNNTLLAFNENGIT